MTTFYASADAKLCRHIESSGRHSFERWTDNGWEPFPALIDAWGIGGDVSYQVIDPSEARGMIVKLGGEVSDLSAPPLYGGGKE